MRPPVNATLDMKKSCSNLEKHQTSNNSEDELYVGDDGLICATPVDDKIRLDNVKILLERRERELRQAAEYGLGLLESNEELQMQKASLKIQLETKTGELSVERDTWQRRTEHAQQEAAQWKRKFARVEEEKTLLAEEFEQFARRCKCRGQSAEALDDDTLTSSGRKLSHHLDTIAQLQTELQEAQAVDRLKEAELTSLRQWKEVAEQQQQETLECEVLTAQSESSQKEMMEQELTAIQRTVTELKNEKDVLLQMVQQREKEMRGLEKQLRIAEEDKDDAVLHSNELSEELLSSKSRCKRLQRELELLEHVSYFSQAMVDCDDERSDEDDEIVEVKDTPTSENQVNNSDSTSPTNDAEKLASSLRAKRRRSFLVRTLSPYSSYISSTVDEDRSHVQVSESEIETHKKLHHYFHLTALSIIHENNLLDRCFDSSSRLTIDVWYREIIAKKVPFLAWHSWLINRISEVAASVQAEDSAPLPPPSSSKRSSFGSAFHGFYLRKSSSFSDTESAKNSLPSPSTVSSSPVFSPVTRVPVTVARAFFRLLRMRSNTDASPSSEIGCPTSGSPAG